MIFFMKKLNVKLLTGLQELLRHNSQPTNQMRLTRLLPSLQPITTKKRFPTMWQL